jgi:hypothetical protein
VCSCGHCCFQQSVVRSVGDFSKTKDLSSHNHRKEPMKDGVMPLGLQKYTLLKRFNKLNPDAEAEYLDWDWLDDKCCYDENLLNMKQGNPAYVWYKPLDEQDIERMETDRLIQEKLDTLRILQNAGLDEEAQKVSKEIDEIEASFSKKFDTGWHVEQTEEGEMHTIEVEIKPHKTGAKGKKYSYGRIQLTVDPALVGLKAKISVFKAKDG